ncbi:hypothetical protein OCH239_20295 [Roseivivax halodurans JCM 10272]|uniref:Peptidase S8/S53 domain-containing protein n=1 Tax=Roseivivax halodurans JCM 10272 TaxID=1449350 RepID=X7E4L8_9RHOB|nr:S8 family serine peptidase [Roseivivax halodurans]ETX10994.1 hypothetical protein OCH239_20295 [Roseivivax halodurans JCM 10272]
MKNVLALTSIILLCACRMDGSGGSGSADPGDGAGGATPPGQTAPDLTDAGGWTRGFVESFDPAKVAAIRSLAGFAANSVRIRLRIEGHPIFDEAQELASNALEAARVDYAHSTGLTGAGRLVAMMDDGVYAGHEQFDGKRIRLFGDHGSAEHGTRVASVIAGTGKGGGALGVAPGADLLVGGMDFSRGIDFGDQAAFLREARAAGAIAVNNSWAMQRDLGQDRPSDFLRRGDGRDYLEALRDFAQSGVIVFSMQNDHAARSAHLMAAIPLDYPDLEDSFLTAVNAIPVYDDERIISATRISAGCMETARYCMTGNGQIWTATHSGRQDYGLSTGTSFAAPQLAGSMALLAEAFPDLTPQQLRARLLVTADNGFFDATGEVEFADGITHGYNAEFGHGFLNLRDALLPIGGAGVPVAAEGGAKRIALGTAAITGSALSGNAVAASLGDASIVAVDALDGVFALPGDAVAGRISAPDLMAYRLAMATGGDLTARRASLAAGLSGAAAYDAYGSGSRLLGAIEMSGNAALPVAAGESFLLEMVGFEEGGAGLRYRQGLAVGSGQLILGVSALQEDGQVLGMTAPGYEDAVVGESFGLEVALSQRLGEGLGLRFEGEFGVGAGSGGGMVRSFDNIRYDALRVSMERSGVFSDGDVMTAFASRPAGLSRGSAEMTLPVAAAGGTVTYADRGIDLAPDARQMDLGIEYATAIGSRTELRLGLASSLNAGHERGARDHSAVVGVGMRF